MNIGANIRRERKRLGLTIAELASRLDTATQNVQRWETGVRTINASQVSAVSHALGVPVELLFREDASQSPHARPWIARVAALGAVDAGEWSGVVRAEALKDAFLVGEDKFADLEKYALLVDGPSINRRAPEGAYLVFVHVDEYLSATGRTIADLDDRIVHVVREGEADEEDIHLIKVARVGADGAVTLASATDQPAHQSEAPLSDDMLLAGVAIGQWRSEGL